MLELGTYGSMRGEAHKSLPYRDQIRGMKYGYARVSTEDQNPALQLAALKKAGCQKIL
jgi:Resolvase, N terminal domain